ncbi:hypothetical protein SDC9_56223 [bioreactor metagenome]|uniref:Uncharacterized protein n=1 Tax=bioreactor metagenome TaxID=1076179 RepID=A0A644X187_9ZZZZ
MFWNDACHPQAATRRGAEGKVGAGLNLVRNDGICAVMQFVHTSNFNDVGAGSRDVGPHCIEKVGEIDDVRFSGGVLNDR